MTHYAESLSNNIHIFAKPSCNRNPCCCCELNVKKKNTHIYLGSTFWWYPNIILTPLLDGHFLSTFHPQMRYLYHFKALVAGNSNIWSIGSSMECHEIITKHFFSCPSSWREFWHFFCLFIFRCRVSRQTKKNCEFFWHFWKLNGYLLFWTFGHLYGTPLMMMPIISLNSPFSANNFKW